MSQTNPFTALLAAQPFVLLDGAMATELEARGCDLADSLWSAKVLLENPQLIRDVHLDYFRAGAQVAITASYQATPAGFAARGLDDAQSRALIGKSVELARKAREAYLAENPQAGTLLVAGSVGPYGAFLADGSEYRGDYQRSAAEFQVFHRPRVEALLDAGADLLACETLAVIRRDPGPGGPAAGVSPRSRLVLLHAARRRTSQRRHAAARGDGRPGG